MSIARVRYLGIGQEASYGQQATQLFYADIASANLDTPDDAVIVWRGVANRAPTVVAPGPYVPAGEIVVPVDNLFFGYFLKWALGAVATSQPDPTGNPAVYQHTFTPADTLPSFTAAIGKDIFEHVFLGCVVDELSIEAEKEFALATVSVSAQKDKKASLASPTFAQGYYYPFSRISVMLGVNSLPVESLTLTIANNVDAKEGVRLGSRFPQFTPVGEREVILEMNLTFENTSQLERFWEQTGATQPSANTVYTGGPFAVSFLGPQLPGTGTYYANLEFTIPRAFYREVKQEISGRDRVVQAVALQALYSQADGYEIRARLTNTQEGY